MNRPSLADQSRLKNIHVVMVETSHAGNIGAAARAMKNMALQSLVLVNPVDFPSSEASARASGAADVLHQAQVFQTLPDALAESTLVIGASARPRRGTWPEITPKEAAQILWQYAHQPVALVFGREASGLTNEELDQCQYLSHIPTNADYSSLNVAQAVQVFAYEIFQQMGWNPVEQTRELAPKESLEGLFDHLYQTLDAVDYLDNPHTEKLMRQFRQMVYRAQLHPREVQMLRGVFHKIQRMAKHATSR